MARAHYREWFVHFRFPGANSNRGFESSARKIPSGWEVRKLGEILELNYGKALKKEDRREGEFPVYGSSGIVGTHDTHLVKGPGVIVGRKGNVGSIFWCEEDFFVIDTAYFVTSSLPLRYLFYVLPMLNFINSDVMAPFLMAFSPAEPGKPHPAPWSAVGGGLSHDLHIELTVDTSGNPEWLVGPQALWWVIALLRLKTSWTLSAPVFADRSFREIPKGSGARLFPFELVTRRKMQAGDGLVDLALEDLAWVGQNWKRAAALFHRDRNFALAFRAFDNSTTISSPALGLLTLWSALEHLFAPSKSELRFRVSALIACYLAEPGEERMQIQKKLAKLYDERSQAAHTAEQVEAEAASETFAIMSQVLLKILFEDRVPSREFLEKLLFGAS
jgi:hypothetical protein